MHTNNRQHFLLTGLLCLGTFYACSQQNLRAWYAQGQVWVVWQSQNPFPETYAIYKNQQAFTATNQASIIGRPFFYEFYPGTFIQQTGNPNFAYTIPKPDGGTYTLAPGEALFVETVTATGTAYYAVVEWGKTAVTAGVNRTQNAVAFMYDPVNDPVTCHLQLTENLATGNKANWYCLWLFGKQAQWSGRPDFPVMANVAKNGMPAMFIVSEALNMDTSGGKRIPATHWLHGGGGNASQHTAADFRAVNIAPALGISVSHTDDFPQKLIYEGDTVFSSARTQWFGWTKTHNPFDPGFKAKTGDTIVNYVQRRIVWIQHWLTQHYGVDPVRVAIQGYSMGSGGAAALGKTFPNLFSTISAFNNGFRRVNEPTISGILGTVEDNLPTNLRDGKNQIVRINEVMDLNTPISAPRDLPLFRTWAGKNDPNDRMHWGPDLVTQYRKADSLGWGTQISWDERPHIYETLGFHWIQNTTPTTQTIRDNLAYQELYSSQQSFPAFFNHRLDARNNNPGMGKLGINLGDGDNWGTWGGWHNWDLGTVKDESASWEVSAWLTATAPFPNDVCPHNSLKADLAIRKPQQFKPSAGKTVRWMVKDASTGAVLQSGNAVVRPDLLVVLPQIEVFKENIRRVRIVVSDPSVAAKEPAAPLVQQLQLSPNPAGNQAVLNFYSRAETPASLRVISYNGVTLQTQQVRVYAGENRLPLSEFAHLPPGFYWVEISGDSWKGIVKWAKI